MDSARLRISPYSPVRHSKPLLEVLLMHNFGVQVLEPLRIEPFGHICSSNHCFAACESSVAIQDIDLAVLDRLQLLPFIPLEMLLQ